MRTLRTPGDRLPEVPEFDHRPGYAEVPEGGAGMPGVRWRSRRAVEPAPVVAERAGER